MKKMSFCKRFQSVVTLCRINIDNCCNICSGRADVSLDVRVCFATSCGRGCNSGRVHDAGSWQQLSRVHFWSRKWRYADYTTILLAGTFHSSALFVCVNLTVKLVMLLRQSGLKYSATICFPHLNLLHRSFFVRFALPSQPLNYSILL
jgi:hypothetical protein